MWVEIKSKVSQRFKRRRSKNRSPRCQQAVEGLICSGGAETRWDVEDELQAKSPKHGARLQTFRERRCNVWITQRGGVTAGDGGGSSSVQADSMFQKTLNHYDIFRITAYVRRSYKQKLGDYFFVIYRDVWLGGCRNGNTETWSSAQDVEGFFSPSSLASFFLNVWLLTRPLALSKSYPGIRLFDRSIINAVFIFIPSAFLCLFTPMCPHLPGFLFSLSGVDVTRKEEIEWVLIFTVVSDANSENSCIFCTIWHVYRSATCCLNSC